jgi:hypothetical protein
LLIDGAPIPNGAKYFPPYVWTGAFPVGGYTLELLAIDLAGNTSMSEPVHIGVDQDPPQPEPEPSDTETGGDEGPGETGTGGDNDSAIDGDSGCACSGPTREPGFAGLALLLLGGLAVRRRPTEFR